MTSSRTTGMNHAVKPLLAGVAALAVAGSAAAVDLSPDKWPVDVRKAAELAESQGMTPLAPRLYAGRNGTISGTASAISVAAGLVTLQNGGNAADAATAIAMTAITTQIGSVVSYAGIMSMTYYEAKTGKVTSLDAGYNSYREETDPLTIPVADLGMLSATNRAATAGGGNLTAVPEKQVNLGRETLVGGYMAGFEAIQQRYGRLKWADLFAPAIYYAEHGVTLNKSMSGYFHWRRAMLERTAEGRDFLAKGGTTRFAIGDKFRQPDAAKTLRAVATQGARYMYSGAWADEFVATVRREGGKVVKADLADYRPVWSAPVATRFAGTTVYVPGGDGLAALSFLPLLNLTEASGLERPEPLWRDPQGFAQVTRIVGALEGAPNLKPSVKAALDARGIGTSPSDLLSKDFAVKVAPLLATIGVAPEGDGKSHHSNSLVVVDKQGNIAAITHTINSVVWGSTGIVVGGIPIPDSAGFQQQALAKVKPGARLPDPLVQTIVIKSGKPVLATAAIGSGLVPESLKILLGVLAEKRPLAEVQAAPPLLSSFPLRAAIAEPGPNDVALPEGGYDAAFVDRLKANGLAVHPVPAATAAAMRGTTAAIHFDARTGSWQATETPGVLLFGATY